MLIFGIFYRLLPVFPDSHRAVQCWSVGDHGAWSMTNTSSLGPAAAGSHSCTLQLDHILIAADHGKKKHIQAYPLYFSF